VTVETYLGASAYGPRYAAAVPVRGLLERRVRVVRDKDGNEVTSSATLRTDLDRESALVAESRVTLPDGRKAKVIGVEPQDGGGLPVPNHLEVHFE
jgi:hypothetical protein